MNLTISLTLDGLVRALRWREHDLAENVQRRYLPPGNADEADDIERADFKAVKDDKGAP